MKSTKVIRGADVERFRQAQEVLAAAHVARDALLSAAARQARADSAQHLSQSAAQADQDRARAALEAVATRDRYLAEIEHEIAGVVMSAMRAIVADYSDTQRATQAAANAIAQLRPQRGASVRVHPTQFEAVREAMPPSITVERDSAVAPGSCMVATDAGVIATDLESQMLAVEQALHASVPRAAAAHDQARSRGTTE